MVGAVVLASTDSQLTPSRLNHTLVFVSAVVLYAVTADLQTTDRLQTKSGGKVRRLSAEKYTMGKQLIFASSVCFGQGVYKLPALAMRIYFPLIPGVVCS